MALRNIVQDGDPILKKVCKPVTDFGPRLHELLDDMVETLIDAHGLGLAASQVGVLRRACIVAEVIEPAVQPGDDGEQETYFDERIDTDDKAEGSGNAKPRGNGGAQPVSDALEDTELDDTYDDELDGEEFDDEFEDGEYEDDDEYDEQIIYHELINPVITKREGEKTIFEGCLSVPGRNAAITRPAKVWVTAQDRYGKQFSFTAEDVFARACCHEVDHLNGVTIHDLAKYYYEDLSAEQLKELDLD